MSIKTLYIFRHGETDWNKEMRMQGRVDIPLNETGRGQALKLREFFLANPIEVILSSDLSRARETAEIARGDLQVPLLFDARLRETNLGDAEGLVIDEVASRFGQELVEAWRSVHPSKAHHRFPNGESKSEHLARVLLALNEFVRSHPYQVSGVSTHGGAIRRLIHHLRPELEEPAMIGNCVLYELKFDFRSDLSPWLIDLEPKCR